MREDKIPTVCEPDPVLFRLLVGFCGTLAECGESMQMKKGEELPCPGVFIPCLDLKTAEAVQEALRERQQIARACMGAEKREQIRTKLMAAAAVIVVPHHGGLAPAHR